MKEEFRKEAANLLRKAAKSLRDLGEPSSNRPVINIAKLAQLVSGRQNGNNQRTA